MTIFWQRAMRKKIYHTESGPPHEAMERRRMDRGTGQSSNQAKNYIPSGAPGGGRQTQFEQVRAVHRREPILRRGRGAEAAVQKGPGIEALAGPAHQL